MFHDPRFSDPNSAAPLALVATVEVAAGRLALLAKELGTERGALFRVAGQTGAFRAETLIGGGDGPCPIETAISAPAHRGIVDHAMRSAIALWWGEDDCGLAGLRWASRIAAGPGGRSGLCLPVHAEGVGCGIAVFAGEAPSADHALLCEVHARAFTLFAAFAEMARQPVAAPSLSRRELQCLAETAKGATSDEIAKALGLSAHTANQYLASATQKLGASNRMHAVAKALRLGIIR